MRARQILNGLGKYIIKALTEPFSKLTCTIIAGIIGCGLGAHLQKESWKEQNKLSMLESDRKQAECIFNEVSSLMDDRYYKTVRLLSAYKQNDSVKIDKYKQSLVLQLEQWNANYNRTCALVEGYFGPKHVHYFKHNIQHNFATVGNKIIYSGASTVQDQKYIDSQLDMLSNNIATLNRMMIGAIKENKVGRFSE